MAKMKCRCGNDLEFEIKSEKFVVFCNSCYTNYVMKREGNNFKIELVYYFPDD